jgi:hypothetical protein
MTLLLLVMCVAPAAILGAIWAFYPSPHERPRWRVRLAQRLERFADHLRRGHPRPPDPFRTLTLQTRLGAVADHARALEQEPKTFALAERLIATQLAYDQLLAEACGLAGVEVLPRAKGDPQERFREEVELASRGWSW